MSEEFIGNGWAFPLRTDATGGVALVSREREIEESIRLILGHEPGRAADAARSSGAASTTTSLPRPTPRPRAGSPPTCASRSSAGSRGSSWRASTVSPDPCDQTVLYIDVRYSHRHRERSPQPRVPVLRDPGRGTGRPRRE